MPDSTDNPTAKYDTRSVMNEIGIYVSATSPYGFRNPLATRTPQLYAADGTYLGKLSTNKLDPESVSNPLGIYGNPISPTSIWNRIGPYGSEISPFSPFNKLTTDAPIIVAPQWMMTCPGRLVGTA